ncbi:MAG: hypothetical protein VX498_01935, partial [Myxococcota bacterium]|nr:hypothetical protein [Myxococcota bacterium]
EQVARRKPEEEAARARPRGPELEPILTNILQRSPQRRYQTAAEFASVLRPLIDRLPAGEGLQPFLKSIDHIVAEHSPQALSGPLPASNGAKQPPPVVEGLSPVSGPGAEEAALKTPEVESGGFDSSEPTPIPNLAASAASPKGKSRSVETTIDTDSHPKAIPRPAEVKEAPDGGRAQGGLAQPEETVGPTRLMPPEPMVRPRQDPKNRRGIPVEPTLRNENRGRQRRPVRRTGPSTLVGVLVALSGLVLLGIGLLTYLGVGSP